MSRAAEHGYLREYLFRVLMKAPDVASRLLKDPSGGDAPAVPTDGSLPRVLHFTHHVPDQTAAMRNSARARERRTARLCGRRASGRCVARDGRCSASRLAQQATAPV